MNHPKTRPTPSFSSAIHAMAVRFSFVVGIALGSCLLTCESSADEAAERFIREAQNRAEYWKARGYEFDPFLMSADSMDRQVANEKRAVYWLERGFKFDPKRLTAWAMDRKAESRLRAEYWKRWGIEFDSEMMDAATMDDAAVKLKGVQDKLKALTRVGEESPVIVADPEVAEILRKPPEVRGGKRRNQPLRRNAAPAPLAINQAGLGGMGMGLGGGLGGGNRGGGANAGGPGIGGNGNIGNSSGRRSGSSTIQVPPGIEPEDFFQFLQRLQSGF